MATQPGVDLFADKTSSASLRSYAIASNPFNERNNEKCLPVPGDGCLQRQSSERQSQTKKTVEFAANAIISRETAH
jgi:hypothetical protein